ncbi:DUF4166 domain-containing protein [Paenibacillus eucommiae]|uniref:DUF4166 domain-containing protein n=1 Tax=Paenibacillus eucommiae TaxID=1355755 RepID=A0ABS4IT61_9BACL|nr:DUF4166 domain-containing protein [Paenibacillus eucommiae]MBP1990325.1 hypothetical protein [Paenibacillus eucommiae]
MPSIYEQALGSDFTKLHPKIQERFSLHSTRQEASIGRGVMSRIWMNRCCAFPFLHLGSRRNLMFPQTGRNVPFEVENYTYQDTYGREVVTWNRTFRFPNRIRRFDATMIYSEKRGTIVDYLGNHQHLAVDIEVSAANNGGIRIRSGEQRFYENWLQFRFPLMLSGTADVCEWYDDVRQQYYISVDVRNRLLGQIFGYEGTFQAQRLTVSPSQIPICAQPLREEIRE